MKEYGAAMTTEKPPIRFKHPCDCGGFAHSMNGRDPRQPHMTWCGQYAEYAEYVRKWGVPGEERS